MTEWSFEETLTAREARELLGVSSQTVYRWTISGVLASRLNPKGRGRLYSAAQVREIRQDRAESELLLDRRARCYQAALQSLRRRHPREFAALYEVELAACEEASPVSAGDAGDQTNPPTEGDHDDSIEPVGR